MKHIILFISCLLMTVFANAQRVLLVQKGDAESLLSVFDEVNKQNASKDAERVYILIPDGFYDLGERTLTRLSGHNIAVIGQSMEGTVIRNQADYRREGISTTATLQNRGRGNYFQDLTLKNDLEYYKCEPDGRAVTLQDKGDRTICNRVCMLSYQDTYYSDNDQCHHYMQDCEIHGTIDFICGAGDVWFERCLIVTENRTPDGSGFDIIAAPRTSLTSWGYVFNRCTIVNDVSQFNFGRTWHTRPRCVWLYTTLKTPEKLVPTRFDSEGMKISSNYFKEYGTMDAKGRNITPKTNVVTFTLRDHTQPFVAETIMSEEELNQHTLQNVFCDWDPAQELKTIERTAKKLKKEIKLK